MVCLPAHPTGLGAASGRVSLVFAPGLGLLLTPSGPGPTRCLLVVVAERMVEVMMEGVLVVTFSSRLYLHSRQKGKQF